MTSIITQQRAQLLLYQDEPIKLHSLTTVNTHVSFCLAQQDADHLAPAPCTYPVETLLVVGLP